MMFVSIYLKSFEEFKPISPFDILSTDVNIDLELFELPDNYTVIHQGKLRLFQENSHKTTSFDDLNLHNQHSVVLF